VINGNYYVLSCTSISRPYQQADIGRISTNKQCPATQLCPPSVPLPIELYRGLDNMGDHRHFGIFGNRYVCLNDVDRPSYSQNHSGEKLICREHSPGSLREPMPTSLWPAHGLVKLGTTFGLIAAAVCLSFPLLSR
jgi:hypothetical protein